MSYVARRVPGIAAAGAFLACIIAANYVTTEYGLVPVGFGLTATAGTYFAGATFVLRDVVHERIGAPTTVVLIVVGAALSYLLADPFIALASGLAFLVSEAADLAVYAPLRRRGLLVAAVASNVVGALVDSLLFLSLAGFPVTAPVVLGQLVGKLTITAAALAIVGGARALLRQPLNRPGA